MLLFCARWCSFYAIAVHVRRSFENWLVAHSTQWMWKWHRDDETIGIYKMCTARTKSPLNLYHTHTHTQCHGIWAGDKRVNQLSRLRQNIRRIILEWSDEICQLFLRCKEKLAMIMRAARCSLFSPISVYHSVFFLFLLCQERHSARIEIGEIALRESGWNKKICSIRQMKP